MWIDSSTPQESSWTVLSFFALLFLTFFAGLRGGAAVIHHTSERTFKPIHGPQVFHFDAAPVSSFNRFLEFRIAFTGKPYVTQPITFSYDIVGSPQLPGVAKVSGKFEKYSVSTGSSGRTGVLSLFSDQTINYSGIDLAVRVIDPPEGITGVTSFVSVGGRDRTKFQSYFRFAFSFFEGVILYFVVPHLGFQNWKLWSLAQKMTIPLLFAAIAANNPAYLVHAYFRQRYFTYLDLVMVPVFHGILYFTVLVLLDALARRNDAIALLRATPKVVIAGARLVVDFLVRLRALAIADSLQPPLTGSGIGFLLGTSGFVTDIAFVAGALLWGLQGSFYVPEGDKPKANAYLAVLLTFTANVALWAVFDKLFGLGSHSELEWLATFVVENAVVLALGAMHWPIETPVAETFDDKQDEEPQPELPAEVLEIEENEDTAKTEEEEEEAEEDRPTGK
jgi:hypothetical protein